MTGKKRPPINAVPVAEGARFSVGSATAFAVRRDNKDIALRIRRERHPLRRAIERIPFARGIQRLVLSIFGLMDGISESFELEPQRIVRGGRAVQSFCELFRIHPESMAGFFSGLLIPILLVGFMVGLPLAVETWVLPNFELSRPWINGIICFARVIGAFLGLFLCARLRVVNRMCMYRGAINKVLNAYEKKRHTPALSEVMEASRLYRVSDAAFLMLVLVISLMVFSAIRTFTLPIQLLIRFLTVLAVAAVINEPIRALESLRPSDPLSALQAPYLCIERMFVMEPHRQMAEVALCAFNAARENNL